MAFADPQSVTISTVAQSLPRTTGTNPSSGYFTKIDGNLQLEISHTQGSRIRHLVKLASKKVVADPLVPSQNIAVSYSSHIVIDMPRNGVTVAEAAAQAAGLTGWATEANLTRVLAGES
jgi:hypothetical protein